MNKIINLTQYQATQDQIAAGVIDLTGSALQALKYNLIFSRMPNKKSIKARAERIAALAEAHGFKKAMCGGAPYLMSALESALKDKGIIPVYTFAERVYHDEMQPDGTVKKVSIFRHQGFIEV